MTPRPEPASLDGFSRLELVRAEAGHITSVSSILSDIDRWIEDGSGRPLEAYLHLPTTDAGRRRYRRDKWLLVAAEQIPARGPWVGAKLLKKELDTFLSCVWFAWQEDELPPAGATPLRKALFFAVRNNDGEDLGVRQLYSIVRSIWPEKLREIAPTLPASMDAQESPDD